MVVVIRDGQHLLSEVAFGPLPQIKANTQAKRREVIGIGARGARVVTAMRRADTVRKEAKIAMKEADTPTKEATIEAAIVTKEAGAAVEATTAMRGVITVVAEAALITAAPSKTPNGSKRRRISIAY